jgi:hypothetical protein
MGWNTGWEILQAQSINIYNEVGKEQFDNIAHILIAPFQETDIDEGGKDYNWFTNDGKEMEQIIVDAMWLGFHPDNIAEGDFEGDVWDEYDHKRWAYIKAFYLIIHSRKWQQEKHTLMVGYEQK